jgi:stearoyl-CoA desaturase (delta-9 desaturase)
MSGDRWPDKPRGSISKEGKEFLTRTKYRWGSIVLIGVLTFTTLVLCPIHLWYHGLSRAEFAFFAFYALASSLSITFGYHRLFSHAAFKAAWPVRLLVLAFGGAAFEQSAMRWAALHRLHHRYTDTDLDPYNIKRGFFYAHVGWILVRIPDVDYAIVRDLARDPLVNHQHQHYRIWSNLWGLVVPLLIGAWIGGWTYAILFPVAARIFLVLNSAFFINSVAHSFGDRPFNAESSARDHWLGVVLTNGEGYHNFHHRFPNDYRNGVRWYHWDPTKWLIWLLSLVGLTSELKRTSTDTIELVGGQRHQEGD